MNSNIGVGEYLKEDYDEILNLSSDRGDMEESWEEWKTNKTKALKKFKSMGMITIDIIVTPSELVEYCREKGVEINGRSRASFIAYKTSFLG